MMDGLMSHLVNAAATRSASEIKVRVHSLSRRVTRVIVLVCLTSCRGDSGVMPVIPAPVATVVVTPKTQVVFVGAPLQLSATMRDAQGNVLTGRVVSWSTSDAYAAIVSATGLVTAVGQGAVTITATSEGKSGSAVAVAVIVPVASVEVTPLTTTLSTGFSQQLTARALSNTGQPLPGRVVTWSSSDESRVRVSATGLITAVGVGTVALTATSEGRSASVQVRVVAAG